MKVLSKQAAYKWVETAPLSPPVISPRPSVPAT